MMQRKKDVEVDEIDSNVNFANSSISNYSVYSLS